MRYMEYEFLKGFKRRMKNVGAYALLYRNSMPKQTWKQYGFDSVDDQTNLLFSVLLFIMEQSLKEENCTLSDIGGFIDSINMKYYQRTLSYEDCRELGDFIVNVILCDDGKPMYFHCYDYELEEYEDVHISFVANQIVYIDGDVKRTSYYLTEDGYNLLLSTLEIENNLKLTIQEMIFKLHLEKASYDRAAADIKNIFNYLRIQLQKIQDAMRQIRQNALSYSVKEYSRILEENIASIEDTKKKFLEYREYVGRLVKELEQQNIHIEKLQVKEAENLENLHIIEDYLSRGLAEHQKILLNHFDLKAMYTKELELLSQMSLIQRFQFRKEFYQEVLKKPESLSRAEYFLRPLFVQNPDKIYNLMKATEFQKRIKERELEEAEAMEETDQEEYLNKVEEERKLKLAIYHKSLFYLLSFACKTGSIKLSKIKEIITEEERAYIIPSIEVFKEIMIELLKVGQFDINQLKQEQTEHFEEQAKDFQISHSILEIVSETLEFSHIKKICVYRCIEDEVVEFDNVVNEHGELMKIKCSDVCIQMLGTVESFQIWEEEE